MGKKDKNAPKPDLVWKATAALATLASGFIADKAVSIGWKMVTGNDAPKDEDKLLDYRVAEVAVFAVISGATMAVVRELSLRGVAQWYGGKDLNPLTGEKMSAKA
ncbi:DUF4235 domain-containing protein [Actinomyces vulturis]|uniref:DUF4235 domain-containing protein n=1 Tax=Actinomyces vulturis TaxID=1857645 RepID=UPI00083226AA|nr:DUF4235 domain-containing protein [Actinomyces vulturis]